MVIPRCTLWHSFGLPCVVFLIGTQTKNLSTLSPSFDQKVDDTLDPNQTSFPGVRDDLLMLALVNKVGVSWRAFPTFLTFQQPFTFRNRGPGMIWDAHTKTHTESLADERVRAMGFQTGTTTTPSLSEGQRRFMLGQAMDFHTMVWTVGLCLALQQQHGNQLLSLRVENFD